MAETGFEQSREVLQKLGTASTEAADVMQDCCSTALKGMQDYNSKVVEFTQDNIKSNIEFMQELVGVKLPSELLDLSTKHTRKQFETLAEQTKELAALAQKVSTATAKPLTAGFAKSFDQAA
jgi:phasin